MAFPSPSLTPPTLENYQWQYNGLTFGAGTPFAVKKAEGFDLATITSEDVAWPREYGQAIGLDLLESRDIIFDLWVKTDGTSLQESQLELAKATQTLPNEELPLWFQLPNLPLMCVMCRTRKRKTDIDVNYSAGNIAEPELSLHATDPRIYSTGKEQAFTPNVPATTHTLTNSGNTETRPILIFSGEQAWPYFKNKSIPGEPFLEIRNPKARREREEAAAKTRHTREGNEETARNKWFKEKEEGKISTPEYEAKLATQKTERESAEATEKTERETAEATEKTEAEKGEIITVAKGDQILIDTGVPHRILYYTGGIASGVPTNIASWLTPDSTWFDLPPEENEIEYGSANESATEGTGAVQWAEGWQL